jgi:hypothetical protein
MLSLGPQNRAGLRVGNLCALPEPHPLDYDWRFTADTIKIVCALLPKQEHILAVGAPSIARRVEALGGLVTLVDRQPCQGVRDHRIVEVGVDQLAFEPCGAAIVDPPWYPFPVRTWTAWTAKLVGLGRPLFVSLWPDEVRPRGAQESDRLLKWMSEWATVELISSVLHYEKPKFERIAQRVSVNGYLASSPRQGRLFKLRIKSHPTLSNGPTPADRWFRFVLDNYQLALRLGEVEGISPGIQRHSNALGWIWPYVSKRAPGREMINIWSSRNEVGVVGSPGKLLDALRRAVHAPTSRSFETELGNFAELSSWDIPRPPYRRLLEWQHRE